MFRNISGSISFSFTFHVISRKFLLLFGQCTRRTERGPYKYLETKRDFFKGVEACTSMQICVINYFWKLYCWRECGRACLWWYLVWPSPLLAPRGRTGRSRNSPARTCPAWGREGATTDYLETWISYLKWCTGTSWPKVIILFGFACVKGARHLRFWSFVCAAALLHQLLLGHAWVRFSPGSCHGGFIRQQGIPPLACKQ